MKWKFSISTFSDYSFNLQDDAESWIIPLCPSITILLSQNNTSFSPAYDFLSHYLYFLHCLLWLLWLVLARADISLCFILSPLFGLYSVIWLSQNLRVLYCFQVLLQYSRKKAAILLTVVCCHITLWRKCVQKHLLQSNHNMDLIFAFTSLFVSLKSIQKESELSPCSYLNFFWLIINLINVG